MRTLSVILLAAASPALAEGKATATVPSAGGSVIATLLSLALVVAVILVLAWLFRRLQGRVAGGSGALRVVGGVALGSRERAVLIQAGEQQLLVGIAPGQVRTLHVFDKPVEEAGPPAGGSGSSFAARLRESLRQSREGRQ